MLNRRPATSWNSVWDQFLKVNFHGTQLLINPLWPINIIWWHGSWSTGVQFMALPRPMLTKCKIWPLGTNISEIKLQNNSLDKKQFIDVVCKLVPFCSGLSVLSCRTVLTPVELHNSYAYCCHWNMKINSLWLSHNIWHNWSWWSLFRSFASCFTRPNHSIPLQIMTFCQLGPQKHASLGF